MRPEHHEQRVVRLILPKVLHQHIFVEMDAMDVGLFWDNHRRRRYSPGVVIGGPCENEATCLDGARHCQARLQNLLREHREFERSA